MSVQTGKTIVTLMLIVQTHLGHLNVHATVVSLEMGRPAEVILPYMLRCIRAVLVNIMLLIKSFCF